MKLPFLFFFFLLSRGLLTFSNVCVFKEKIRLTADLSLPLSTCLSLNKVRRMWCQPARLSSSFLGTDHIESLCLLMLCSAVVSISSKACDHACDELRAIQTNLVLLVTMTAALYTSEKKTRQYCQTQFPLVSRPGLAHKYTCIVWTINFETSSPCVLALDFVASGCGLQRG